MIEKTKDLLTSIARAEMMIGNVLIDSAMVAQIDRLITEFRALGIPLRPLTIFAAICDEGGTDEDAVTAAVLIERRLAEVGYVADRERSTCGRPTSSPPSGRCACEKCSAGGRMGCLRTSRCGTSTPEPPVRARALVTAASAGAPADEFAYRRCAAKNAKRADDMAVAADFKGTQQDVRLHGEGEQGDLTNRRGGAVTGLR